MYPYVSNKLLVVTFSSSFIVILHVKQLCCKVLYMTQLFDFLYSEENNDKHAVYINGNYVSYREFKNNVLNHNYHKKSASNAFYHLN